MTEVCLRNHRQDHSTDLQTDLLLILQVRPRSPLKTVPLDFLQVESAHRDLALDTLGAEQWGFLVFQDVVFEVLQVDVQQVSEQ